ncbi:hypothetical protein HBH53_028280 [Parastagonospora nodorum]|nr:hypothetical protein HBH53_028280 [Parastagonospora nodorum]
MVKLASHYTRRDNPEQSMDRRDLSTMDSPPPPSDDGRLLSSNESFHDSVPVHPFEGSLEWVEDMQEDLRDAREDLVGSRFRLRTKRQELRATGEKAFVAMGRAFDLMRRRFLIEQLNVPEDMISVWLQVDKIRNALGEQDVEYEQAENDYNMEEWQYTETEGRFVQSVQRCRTKHVNSHDPPSIPGSLSERPTQIPFFQPPDYIIKDSLAIELDRAHPFSGVPITVMSPQGEQEIQTSVESHSAPITDTTSIFSYLGANLADDLSETDSQDREDGHCRVADADLLRNYDRSDAYLDRWSNSRQYIDRWMLEVLTTSSLQKQWLERFVPKGNLSDGEWLTLVTKHWESTSSNASVFHTGDTTVSDESVKKEMSSDGVQRPFESSTYCSSDTWQPSGSPVFPDGRVADHQASFNNPVKIRARDLIDDPRHVTFSIVPSRSYSDPVRVISADPITSNSEQLLSAASTTTQTKGAYARSLSKETSAAGSYMSSTSRGNSSVSTIEAEPSFRFSAERHVLHPGGDIPNERVTIPSYIEIKTKAASQGEQSSKDELQHMKTSKSNRSLHTDSESNGQALMQSNAQEQTASEHKASMEEADTLLTRRPWSHTRYPFAPFIRVKSSEPWTLPLLRLTPIPTLSFDDLTVANHSSRLENVPFVSISDTPWRLPGPYSSWVA